MEQRRSDRRDLKLFVDHVLGENEQCVCVSDNFSAGGIRSRVYPDRVGVVLSTLGFASVCRVTLTRL